MKQKLLSFFVLFMLSIGLLNAQSRQVSGKVTDATTGTPLSGVSVKVVGLSTATQTDEQGNYSIMVNENGRLTFSFIGYETLTQSASGRSTLNISLISTSDALDEVVVVAYGTVKKSDFTGSATQIGTKEIDKRPISNVLTALQGAGPGIQSSAPSGAPGSSPGIRIRGFGSYSAGQGALVVVDGVPFDGGMTNINPADVESVTVLKDAATIAMYGSRGANGVIMVTTKQGKSGQSELNVSAQYGFNKNGVPAYETVDAGQYYELMWQAYTNNLAFGSAKIPMDVAKQLGSGLLPRNAKGLQTYNGKTYQDIVQYLGNYNAFDVPNDALVGVDGKLNPNAKFRYEGFTSWEDEAARAGKRNEYNLNYSGGFNSTDIYTSLNYLKDNGWGLRSMNERFQGRVNVNTKVTDWLKTGVNLNAASRKADFAYDGGGINNPFYFSRGIAPIYPVYVHDPETGKLVYDEFGVKRYDYGNLVSEFGLSRPFNSGRHAIAETMYNTSKSNRDFIGARAYMDVNVLPWLTFTMNFSPDLENNRSEGYENTIVGDGAPAGRYNQSWYRQLSYTFNQLLRANNTFGLHNLETVLGHEFYSYKIEDLSGMRTGQGFQGVNVMENFTDISSLTSGLRENSIESYFGRVNYNYNSRYYLSAMLRADGNSRFPANLRWENFWSVGAAWRLDQEDFFKNDYTDLLKLRFSYGQLGNSDLSSYYPYQPGYEIGYNNASTPGSIYASLGSDRLTWETQKPLDVGVDFSFLNGRLSGSLEYYYRNSDGLLFSVNQPYHNGGTTAGSYAINQNVGAMTNKGIEASVTGGLIRKENFNWNLTVNVTTVKNEITAMPKETPELVSSPYKRAVGRSLYDYYTRTYYGVDPENGNALYLGLADGVTYDASNPEHKLIENNGRVDTVTSNHNSARQSWLDKSAIPPVYGSVVNDFTYKNFDFRFVLTYSVGGYFYDGYYAGLMSSGPSNGANLHSDLFGAWKNPGDVTDIPRMDVGRTSQHGAASSRWLTKASYLNISAINVGYRIPESFSGRIGIKRARIYASAENLYFWSAKKGFNPVGGLTGPTGNSSYNHARTFNFGINFGL
ncbi:SusC/RagA family TonB-linked outer membrane protein [Sphingobacterium mizutaii]|uniref:SusC/RagA family TonB-linked outer membrane protein n=1 Tax=Sphingobacterium mizutaii TaxID=1010 RepID=UPI001623A59C|nr:SusC/RagA family TonB-linked outer membrane protein [Sphingobacterium mizutaii]